MKSISIFEIGDKAMALKKCQECDNIVSDQAEKCPRCGASIKSVKAKTELKMQKKWYERSSITLCIAAFLILIGFGFIHIITGIASPLGLPIDIALKDSFGYSETFVNADKVTGMPWIAAKSQYPLGCKVLQRKHYIESDDEFEERVKKETQEELKRLKSNLNKNLKQPYSNPRGNYEAQSA